MTTIEEGDELARILRLRIEAGREDDMVTIALSVADAELLLAQHNGATQVEAAYREGWWDGQACDIAVASDADVEADWQNSDTRAALSTSSPAKDLGNG